VSEDKIEHKLDHESFGTKFLDITLILNARLLCFYISNTDCYLAEGQHGLKTSYNENDNIFGNSALFIRTDVILPSDKVGMVTWNVNQLSRE
jgi:hypothetical protein